MRPNKLNSLQWEAVTHDKGHLLIVAGPGTGKTHTLTQRVRYIIRNLPGGKKVLAITFTHKAAEEMRQRLSQQPAGVAAIDGAVTVGTFHQFCMDILRSFADKTDLPRDFQLASPEQIETLSRQAWPEKTNKERRLSLIDVSEWKAAAYDAPMPAGVQSYNKILRKEALLDFDDLLLEALMLLRKDPGILAALRGTYAHIFVDEYQDINAVQRDILKMLVGGETAITAIGDPNQAIYGFRGSDLRYFERFANDFPEATVLSLTDNYRSAKNILSASSQVMAGAGNVRVSALTARMYSEGRLIIHSAATDHAEAEYVTHQIERMVGGVSLFSFDSARVAGHEQQGNWSFGDIAVLYRLNSQRVALQKALDRSGIPYQVSGSAALDISEETIDQFYPSRPVEPDISVEKVSLMTLHASKGLEFPVVFVVGCEENILPLAMGGLTADIEEERRLFYVGMTRAKEALFLTRAERRFLYGQTHRNGPSLFLSDIEEELKEYEQPLKKKRRHQKDDEQLSLF
ncbi:MAG: ATP-dependent helicase [Candidatus Omnitrophica bacterium]|nr:ATP-dependent helicase [Candidatus Omnitrophota bacterium]